MTNEQFESKLRRILEQTSALVHATTLDNAISILEKGLMPLSTAKAEGIEVERCGSLYGLVSNYPNAVSMNHLSSNFVKKGLSFLFPARAHKPYLLIDEKYLSLEKSYCKGNHPIYLGAIPPEDVLALIVKLREIPKSEAGQYEFSFEPCKEVMEAQKQRLSPDKWVPIIFSSTRYEHKSGLYLPKELEVSDEVREKVVVVGENET